MRQDNLFVCGFGVATAVASILLFLLYAFSGENKALANIDVALVCFAAISYWIMRIWFLTLRGQMPEDPVMFAVRDWTSYALGMAILLSLVIDQWIR